MQAKKGGTKSAKKYNNVIDELIESELCQLTPKAKIIKKIRSKYKSNGQEEPAEKTMYNWVKAKEDEMDKRTENINSVRQQHIRYCLNQIQFHTKEQRYGLVLQWYDRLKSLYPRNLTPRDEEDNEYNINIKYVNKGEK